MVGLTTEQAQKLLQQHGPNDITHTEISWHKLLLTQFFNPFNALLFCAAAIAFFLTGNHFEGALIIAIIGFNSFLSFFQEYKASRSLALLKAYLVHHEDVMRDGVVTKIDVRLLVPGDVVLLEPGDIIPADMQVTESQGLQIDESSLTGESQSVAKSTESGFNALSAGTTVVAGKATATVTATGVRSALGKLAGLLAGTERVSTFAKNMKSFTRFIIQIVVVTLVVMFVAHTIIKGPSKPYFIDLDYLIFFIALAVTIVPEMLPSVITVSLSRGAQQLAKHKVVVKRLSAIEDLGSINILCTDKTGTLTENQMTVADVTGVDKQDLLLHALLSCANGNGKKSVTSFDDAIKAYCEPAMHQQVQEFTHVGAVPFEPARRRASVVVKSPQGYRLIVRGAYEELIKESKNLTSAQVQEISRWVGSAGRQGQRVVAITTKEFSELPQNLVAAERDMTWLGLLSFIDPIKKSTFEAITQARQLGVQIKILTGDSPEVAGYVGIQTGLVTDAAQIMTGDLFDQLAVSEKESAVVNSVIFARIAPQQKLEIVRILQKTHEVGFLGDGINDAPALKAANVGIVVQGAADIAQEAADIVLLKKSLMVIVSGIAQGRTIFANTIKYIKVNLTGGFGHFYAVAIASLFVDFVPMLPLQILLMNILTDFPLLAISTDRVDLEELKEPKQYNVREIAFVTTFFGLISSLFDFIVFVHFVPMGAGRLQTCWFMASLLTESCFVGVIRSKLPIWRAVRPSWQLLLLLVVVATAGLLMPLIPWLRELFEFVQPDRADFIFILFLACAYIVTMEYAKRFYYRFLNY